MITLCNRENHEEDYERTDAQSKGTLALSALSQYPEAEILEHGICPCPRSLNFINLATC